MAWLEKRNGNYRVCWREGRKTRRQTLKNNGVACTDKQVAKARLGDFETKQLRGEAFSDQFKAHRNRPLSEHVGDYISELRTLGRDDKYVYNIDRRLSRLIADCGWKLLSNVTADSFCAWREKPVTFKSAGTSEDRSIGPVTLNQHLETARAFCRWCVKRKRMATNPLADVPKMETTDDIRRERRALCEDEIIALLNLAIVPAEHKLVYRFILATGLRRQEAADLLWGDLHLGCTLPYLALRAKATKARRADTLPLRADIAKQLGDVRGDAADDERVFRAIPSMKRHRRYLKKAGIAWEDEQGRRADFHALRHTYGTMLSKAGVSPRETMSLMRHTDLKLTMNVYTDPRIFNLAGAVERLPIPPADPTQTVTAQATGTDGNAVYQDTADPRVANRVATDTAGSLHLTPVDAAAENTTNQNHSENQADLRSLTPVGTGGKTVRHVGLEPTEKLQLSTERQKLFDAQGSNPMSNHPEIDPDSQAIIDALPTLSRKQRRQILALVKSMRESQ